MNADKRPSGGYPSPRGTTGGGGLPGSKKSQTHNVRPVGKVGARSSLLQMSKTAVAGSAIKTATTVGKGILGPASSFHKVADAPSSENSKTGSAPPPRPPLPQSKTPRAVFDEYADQLEKVSEESANAVIPPVVVPRQSSAACVKVPGSRLPIPNLLGRRNSDERGDAQKSPAVSQTSLRSTSSTKSNVSVGGFEFPVAVQSTLLTGTLESIAEDNELTDKLSDKTPVTENVAAVNKTSNSKRTSSINAQQKTSFQPNRGRQSVNSVKPFVSNNSFNLTSQTKIKTSPSLCKQLAQRGGSQASVVTAASSTTPLQQTTSPAPPIQDQLKTSVPSPLAFVQPVCPDVSLNKATLSNSNTNKANKPNKISGNLQNSGMKQQHLPTNQKTSVTGPLLKNKVNCKLTQKTMPVSKQKMSPPTEITVAKVEVSQKELSKTVPVLGVVEPRVKASHTAKLPVFGAKQHTKRGFTKKTKVAAVLQEESSKTAAISSFVEGEPKVPNVLKLGEDSPNTSLPTLELLAEESPSIQKIYAFPKEGIPLIADPLISQLVEEECKAVCSENDCLISEEFIQTKPLYMENDCQTDEVVEIIEAKPLGMENDCQTDEIVRYITDTNEMPSQTEDVINIAMNTQTPIFTFTEVENQTEEALVFDSDTQTEIHTVAISEVQTMFMLNSNSETQTPSVTSTEEESQTCVAIMLPIDIQATEEMTESETQMQSICVSENESQTADLEIANVESQTSQQQLTSVESQTAHIQIATVESQTSQLHIENVDTQTAIVPKTKKTDMHTSMEVDVVQTSMSFLAVFFLSLIYRIWLRIRVRAILYSNTSVAVELLEAEQDVLELPEAVSSLPFVPGADVSEEDTIISDGAAQLMYSPSTIIFQESGAYSLDEACSMELLQTVAENLESLSSAMAEWSEEGLLSQESQLEVPHPLMPTSEELMRWWHPQNPTRFDINFGANTEYTCNELEDDSSLYDMADQHYSNNISPVLEVLAGQTVALEMEDEEDDTPSIHTAVMSYHSMTMLDAQECEMHEAGGIKADETKSEKEEPVGNCIRLILECGQSSTSYDALEKKKKTSTEEAGDNPVGVERSDEIMAADSLNIDLSFLDCVEEAVPRSCRSVESVRSDSVLFTDADEYLDDGEKNLPNIQEITEDSEKDGKGRVDDECGDSA